MLTQRNNLLIKADLTETGALKGEISVVDDQTLKRHKIRKLYVADSGQHCFMLTDHDLFYNHWSNDHVNRIEVSPNNVGGSAEISQQKSFKSIEVLKYGD